MKFIHIADVHLGAVPDKDKDWSKERAEEITDAFDRLLETAEERQVDLLFDSRRFVPCAAFFTGFKESGL